MKMKRILASIFSLVICSSISGQAQDGSVALSYLTIDRNPASLAMGGTSILNFSSVSHAYSFNPSLVPFMDGKMDAAASWQNWALSGSNWFNFGAALNLGNKLGLTIGADYGMYSPYEMFDENSGSLGMFTPADLTAGLGVSYRVIDILSVGANVRYAMSSVAKGYNYGNVNADIFATCVLPSGFKAAVGASNLGPGVKSASGSIFPIPSSVALAAGYETLLAEVHGFQAELDCRYFLSGSFEASAGFEYCWQRMISIRAGYHYGDLLPSFVSAGLGLSFKGVHLDFAWISGLAGSALPDTLSAGIGFRF